MEMPGFEPGASRMQSERSTTELHPLAALLIYFYLNHFALAACLFHSFSLLKTLIGRITSLNIDTSVSLPYSNM